MENVGNMRLEHLLLLLDGLDEDIAEYPNSGVIDIAADHFIWRLDDIPGDRPPQLPIEINRWQNRLRAVRDMQRLAKIGGYSEKLSAVLEYSEIIAETRLQDSVVRAWYERRQDAALPAAGINE